LTKSVLITGATGFIGRALTRAVIARGDRVIAVTRDPKKAAFLSGPLVEIVDRIDGIEPGRRIDAIVNLAGASVAGGLWSKARKERLVQSRLTTTDAVLALLRRLEVKPEVLLSGSAVGFYGDRGDESLTEASAPQPVFMSQLCQDWEARARQAETAAVRVCLMRTGFVLGNDGGAAKPLALATRFGAGAVMGSGTQIISWIHIDDLVRLICFCIDRPDLAGPVNGVAPAPVSQAEFARSLGKALHRPVFLRVPAALLRTGLGEMADLFLISQRVLPARAQAAGFEFHFCALDRALEDLFGVRSRRSIG